jgi:anhydro-N-acetylmuramic acid kinase
MPVYVGVMSGTSLDGVDVAVVRFEGEGERPDELEVTSFRSTPYHAGLRGRIRSAIGHGSAETVCALDFELGRCIGEAVARALEIAGVPPGEIRAIGSHGQTVWHRPPGPDGPGATLQLGAPAAIVEATGIPVVADFRARDIAAGGHGAPLTAYSDWLLFAAEAGRAIQNIGGMANLTVLPARDDGATPIAFDTGPGVALIDAAIQKWSGGENAFDRDGELASRGSVLEGAIDEWLSDPYFAAPPPKSTGREYFSIERLDRWLTRHDGASEADLAATLTELTARTIARGFEWATAPVEACYLCGGGARNPCLTRRIRGALGGVRVAGLAELGVDPDAREAVAFALLARQHVLGIPANAPWATGAAGPRVLGSWTPA